MVRQRKLACGNSSSWDLWKVCIIVVNKVKLSYGTLEPTESSSQRGSTLLSIKRLLNKALPYTADVVMSVCMSYNVNCQCGYTEADKSCFSCIQWITLFWLYLCRDYVLLSSTNLLTKQVPHQYRVIEGKICKVHVMKHGSPRFVNWVSMFTLDLGKSSWQNNLFSRSIIQLFWSYQSANGVGSVVMEM